MSGKPIRKYWAHDVEELPEHGILGGLRRISADESPHPLPPKKDFNGVRMLVGEVEARKQVDRAPCSNNTWARLHVTRPGSRLHVLILLVLERSTRYCKYTNNSITTHSRLSTSLR